MSQAEEAAHILVVDDDARLRALLQRFLTEQGFRVSTAADAAAARAALADMAFDLMVLDVMMPGETGLELTASLREKGQDVPILMLTARGAPDDRIAGLEQGVDDYLAKPLTRVNWRCAFAPFCAAPCQAPCPRRILHQCKSAIVGLILNGRNCADRMALFA
jgi:CheY-like chemotaxis protein